MLTTREYRLGAAFGVPVYLDLSFLFIAALACAAVGSLLAGLAFAACVGASVVAHEFGHILVARKYGFGTRRVTLSALGGCAEMFSIPKDPGQEMAVAFAGPVVSAALSVVSVCLVFPVAFLAPPLGAVLVYAAVVNAVLCVFNLLPGFPMDGGRILRAWLSRRKSRPDATRAAMNVGRVFAVLLACWGSVCLLSGHFAGVVSLLISWFIWRAGWQEYETTLYSG